MNGLPKEIGFYKTITPGIPKETENDMLEEAQTIYSDMEVFNKFGFDYFLLSTNHESEIIIRKRLDQGSIAILVDDEDCIYKIDTDNMGAVQKKNLLMPQQKRFFCCF